MATDGGGYLTVAEFAWIGMRLLLAAIFLIAGVAKLANRRESIQVLRDFGVPRRLQPLGVLLPPLEIVVAVGLLFARTAWYAAWGTLALLGLFIAGIGVNLARGRQPACNCFGQLHSRPISWRTLVRNGVLAAGAIYLIASGPPPPAADLWVFLGNLDSRGRRVATVVAAVLGFAILHALRQDEPESAPTVSDEPVVAAARRPRQPAPSPRRSLASHGRHSSENHHGHRPCRWHPGTRVRPARPRGS